MNLFPIKVRTLVQSVHIYCRSSNPEDFFEKGVLKICSKFTGEPPCRNVISIKLFCNLLKSTWLFSCKLLHIFTTSFTKNTSGWLLLILHIIDSNSGLMVFAKSHIPLRRFNDYKIPSNIQIIPFEISLRKEKLLAASIYNAPSHKNKYFIWYLTNLVEFHSTRREKVIILGNFNKDTENKVMKDFLHEHTFYNMMKQNTCFKGDGGSCINLLIANSKFSLMKTNSFETGLSDHHHMICNQNKIFNKTFLKTKFEKFELKILIYRNFKQVDNDQFKSENPCSLWKKFCLHFR